MFGPLALDIQKTNLQNTMVKYNFSEDGTVLTIRDSYTVPKKDFQKTLNQIKALHGNMPIFQRTDKSLKREWAVHNFCYIIGYKRERTKDCDLDLPSDKPEWVYKFIGWLVWPFIKK